MWLSENFPGPVVLWVWGPPLSFGGAVQRRISFQFNGCTETLLPNIYRVLDTLCLCHRSWRSPLFPPDSSWEAVVSQTQTARFSRSVCLALWDRSVCHQMPRSTALSHANVPEGKRLPSRPLSALLWSAPLYKTVCLQHTWLGYVGLSPSSLENTQDWAPSHGSPS